MNSIRALGGATVLLLAAAFYPQASRADGFTGKEFSEWSETSQNSFIQTSVTMAGVVLTQLQADKARCIDNWYAKDGKKADRNAFIWKTIVQYADYHPSGTILAILVDACGPLK